MATKMIAVSMPPSIEAIQPEDIESYVALLSAPLDNFLHICLEKGVPQEVIMAIQALAMHFMAETSMLALTGADSKFAVSDRNKELLKDMYKLVEEYARSEVNAEANELTEDQPKPEETKH